MIREAIRRQIAHWDENYSDDQGICTLWSNWIDERTPYSELVREFHPLLWKLGVEVAHDPPKTLIWSSPGWWEISASLGPWSLIFRKEWPAS